MRNTRITKDKYLLLLVGLHVVVFEAVYLGINFENVSNTLRDNVYSGERCPFYIASLASFGFLLVYFVLAWILLQMLLNGTQKGT